MPRTSLFEWLEENRYVIGTTLSHFKITAKLGEGGMGEVYRAEDTKLGREVAIKVLPEAVASDPERLARFEREAKVLASLNHPNIAAIYAFESSGPQDPKTPGPPVHFLVMELVEGEDLAQRLARGAIPKDEALPIALQIAEALETAHESGIIHRDLKPANVKVTPEGQVKVLDFGLAKALDPQDPKTSGRQVLSMSPTLTAQMTQAGVLLGTAAYMSPEQARGQEADKRADIWAFGVLLWEMLAGQHLFAGDTVSDTLAEVLKTDPDLSALPGSLSPSIRRLLQRCLTRDSKQRLRDIGEARIALEQPQEDATPELAEPEMARSKLKMRAVLFGAVLALATGIGGWLVARSTSVSPTAPSSYSFRISEPTGILSGSFALSPDGSQLAFVAQGDDEVERLWVRPLESFAARPLPGTEGARSPFWSPDGREIAFFADDELRRIELGATAARTITSVSSPLGGAWGADGTILIGNRSGPILQIAAAGGATPRPALELTAAEGPSVSQAWPVFLPGGHQYVFLSDGAGGEDGLDHRIQLATLGESESRTLLPGLWSTVEIDPRGLILYGQNNQLVAQEMDFEAGTLTGEPFLIADRVFTSGALHKIPVSISANGTLAFQTGTSLRHLVWRDQSGASLGTVETVGTASEPRLSSDGRYVAFQSSRSSDDRTIWALDLERGVRVELSERGKLSDSPAWSADGKWVYFDTAGDGGWRLFRQPREGSPQPKLVIDQTFGDLIVADTSPDGRWLLFAARDSDPYWDLELLRLDVEGAEPTVWLDLPEDLEVGRFSRDSRWIAYATTVKQNRGEVFIRAVEADDRQWQISSSGGSNPIWSADGRTLYYISRDKHIMSVPIELRDTEVIAGTPQELFRHAEIIPGVFRNVFDQAADGRFLFAEPSGDKANEIYVQAGWDPEKP